MAGSGPRPTENARGQKLLWNQETQVKSDFFSTATLHKQQQHVCTQEGENRVAHCQRCAVRHRRVHHRVRVHSNGIASPPLLCRIVWCVTCAFDMWTHIFLPRAHARPEHAGQPTPLILPQPRLYCPRVCVQMAHCTIVWRGHDCHRGRAVVRACRVLWWLQ